VKVTRLSIHKPVAQPARCKIVAVPKTVPKISMHPGHSRQISAAFSKNLPIAVQLPVDGQSVLGLRFDLCNNVAALGDEVARKLRQAVEDSYGDRR
jgi:hypothetical protein